MAAESDADWLRAWNAVNRAVAGDLRQLVIAVPLLIVIAMTAWAGPRGAHPRDVPVSETLTAPAATGWERNLDRFGLWVAVTIVLCVIAYGPFLAMYLPARLVSPGFRLF